jgi:hypothetical protein
MKAAIFVEPGRIVLESKPAPDVGALHASVRIATTTICGAGASLQSWSNRPAKRPLPTLTTLSCDGLQDEIYS